MRHRSGSQSRLLSRAASREALPHQMTPRIWSWRQRSLARHSVSDLRQLCMSEAQDPALSAGMMWHFDLSAMLGWASTARRTRLPPLGAARRGPDCREGCWLQHRSSSDADPGQWTHPQPLGIVAGDISATQAVFPLPGGPCGGFITSGFCSAATTGSADALRARAEAPTEARAASVAAEGPADTWAALARSAAAARPAAVPQERAAVRPGHMHGLLLFQLNGEAGA